LSLILRNLSQPSRTLITLHRFFLKAICIHHAHNGPHAPAELGRLLEIVTRLWKERLVTQADIQKMLAIYEINAYAGDGGTKEIPQSLSPFKLVVAGSYISVEYIGDRKEMMGPLSTPFDEKDLHDSYRCHVYDLDSAWTRQRLDHLSFFEEDSLENFAKLQCDIGTQTAARKACVSQQRAEILALSTAAQFREKTISTAMGDENDGDLSHGRPVLQNRKQNLLDRIQAKQLASRANAKPTPPHILRQHALGRIKEVVEVLRMMQHQQKGETKSKLRDETSNEFRSDRGAGRVSFSLTQLRSNIQSSASVPISNEEVTMCLKMLSEELDGTWVRTVKSRGTSNAAFVVVEGQGMSGREAHSRLLA
jgi:DNA replication factor Cdt1 C-terminal domain